jgi:hypothetical protein
MKTELIELPKNGRRSKAPATIENNTLVPASPTPLDLLQMAISKDVDLDRLQKLIDMKNEWDAKEAKKEFLAALSKFQTLVPVLKKSKTAKVATKTGGSFSYNYADLGSIAQTIKGALQECGLSYRWEFSELSGKMKVTCIVSHLAGHTETAVMEASADSSGAKNDIQQKGSTHTYLQRYTLIGALGLATADEDNDGNSKPAKKQTPENARKESGHEEEKDVMDQWKQVLSECKSKVHLQTIYMQNKSVVDDSPQLQAMFKERQEELKAAKPQVEMP